jgi:hypothetical protein
MERNERGNEGGSEVGTGDRKEGRGHTQATRRSPAVASDAA